MMHLNRVWPTIGALFLLFVTSVVLAKGNSAAVRSRLYGFGQPHSVNDLPPGQFKSTLEDLSPRARGKALDRLRRFSFPAEDVADLRVDSEGAIDYTNFTAVTTEVASMLEATRRRSEASAAHISASSDLIRS